MQNFRFERAEGMKRDPRPALLLLYAEGYRALEPAFLLSASPATIGRDESNAFRLQVSAVSRRHAELRLERGHWWARDLGSTNGILLDGQRVDEGTLEQHTELRIGDAIFKFVERGGGDYGRYLLDGTMHDGAPRLCRVVSPLVGGFEMDRVSAALEQIAPTNLSVLVLGESGTGKEVAARFLHDQSGRAGPFQAVNCAALPETLIESELFGYKKGAFSGAERDKPGLFQVAHRGTLFLDEIGDMPLAAQAKLLRVLQSREVLPLGATRPELVDVRVVAATHRDLQRLERDGRFRRDLFARLNEFSVDLLPLRERKEDIFQLARAFLRRHGRPELALSFPFMAGLVHHDWPNNVRELESAIKRAAALSSGPVLTEELLPEAVQEAIADYARGTATRPSGELPDDVELRRLLEESDGNIAAVGRKLGKARMQIHRWMKRYGIDIADYRR